MSKTMEEICEAIHRDTEDIVERWVDAAAEEPWFTTPEEKMIDELPAVIRRLADVALRRPGDEGLHRQKVHAAARHGEERREQGIGTLRAPSAGAGGGGRLAGSRGAAGGRVAAAG